MPVGAWRCRRPLPPTPGTTVVCPIGEATPAEVAAYVAAREAESREARARRDVPDADRRD